MQNIIENFEQVWNDSRFKILNLKIENLTIFLSSEKLKNGSQQIVWQVIHDWVVVNKKDRLTHLPKLLKENLQFDRLTKHFVKEKILKNVIFMLLPLCIQTDLKNFVKNFQNELNDASFKLPDLLPIINYYHQTLFCIDISNGYSEIYNQQHNNWHSSPLSLQLPVQQCFFKFELIGSMLYAFGGIEKDGNATNLMWSRDLSDPSSQWTARANMKQRRVWFCSVVLNDTIYALGGKNTIFHYLRSCERYSSKLNKWFKVADMNISRANASAAVINGCIYIAGGWKKRSVSKYCPQTNTWSEVAPMTTDRKNFSLTPFAGRLWAIGGLGNGFNALCSCESYDPVTDTWREEAQMKERQYDHAATEFSKELYVVGGRKKGKNAVEKNTIVNKYVLGNGWTETGQLQKPILDSKLIIVPSVYSKYFNQN